MCSLFFGLPGLQEPIDWIPNCSSSDYYFSCCCYFGIKMLLRPSLYFPIFSQLLFTLFCTQHDSQARAQGALLLSDLQPHRSTSGKDVIIDPSGGASWVWHPDPGNILSLTHFRPLPGAYNSSPRYNPRSSSEESLNPQTIHISWSSTLGQ